ncbi:MAG TPA: PIG-L family deacetylase [Anaerolineaceae bacterium]|nr:PIG-L family deacetylase [Anaerolineaceae bacterium]HPN52966.1 PIG-L family deacetylase [Anaerolineaceae bacterium]
MLPEWDTPKRILVVLAHPDDPEFFCGATIGYLASKGHEIHYALLTRGDKGASDRSITPQALMACREKEQRAAANVLGVKSVAFLDYPDGYLEVNLQTRKDVVRLIRQYRPDVLIGCDPLNIFSMGGTRINHPDHRAAGWIVMDAAFPAAGNPFYYTDLQDEEGLEPHTPQEVWLSISPQPNMVFDATAWFDLKLRALHEHQSQIGDPELFDQRMRQRYAPGGTPEQPRYEENFKRLLLT